MSIRLWLMIYLDVMIDKRCFPIVSALKGFPSIGSLSIKLTCFNGSLSGSVVN